MRAHGEEQKERNDKMTNENDEEISVAPHPQMIVKMKIDYPVEKYSILRKKEDNSEGEN